MQFSINRVITKVVFSSPRIAAIALLLCSAVGALAQGQALSIEPSGRTNLSLKSMQVTLTASGAVGTPPTLAFNPPNMITATPLKWTGDKATTMLTITSNAWGTVKLILQAGQTYTGEFNTGVYCLDATEGTDCAFRFEVDTSAANGSSSQTGKNTAPNIMFKLDYQLAKSKGSTDKDRSWDPKTKTSPSPRGFVDRLTTHLTLDTGYTQINAATKLQPVANGNSATGNTTASFRSLTTSGNTASSSAPCAGTASASSSAPSNCTAATPQQAFVAKAGGTMGWIFGQDGQGTFYELGLAGRAAFEDLVQSNQIVQSGGVSYINLSSNNPRNAIGLYEGVFRFRVGALGHDAPAADPQKQNGKLAVARNNVAKNNGPKTYSHNTSDFLVMEAGYQNNSGLQQLAANPQTSTRNRFVGRFYLYPPLPGTTQTKPMVGMEYSGGINGGPKVVQIFFGVNLNPVKLAQNNTSSNANK